MLLELEFKKRIESITMQLSDARVANPVSDKDIARLEGALAEVERLYAFYREQMIQKDQVKSHEYREG